MTLHNDLLITYIFANYNKNVPTAVDLNQSCNSLISLSLGLSSSPHFLAHPQYSWNTVLASINAQLIKLIVISSSFCSLALLEFLFIMPLQVHTHAFNCRTARASLSCSPHKTSGWWPGNIASPTHPSLKCFMPKKLPTAEKTPNK